MLRTQPSRFCKMLKWYEVKEQAAGHKRLMLLWYIYNIAGKNAVKFIVVKNDRQIPSMIKFIRTSKKIFGTENLSSEHRDLLISRITSFELIEENF